MFILTSLTLPPAALTAFSSCGVSCLHGPHQGAQKSTSTGWRRDSWMTSAAKAAVVVSLIRSAAAGASANATLALSPPPYWTDWVYWPEALPKELLNGLLSLMVSPLSVAPPDAKRNSSLSDFGFAIHVAISP